MEQVAFSLDKASLIKIGKGALIAGGGALIVYVLQEVAKADFGVYSPAIGAICAILINAFKEFVAGK